MEEKKDMKDIVFLFTIFLSLVPHIVTKDATAAPEPLIPKSIPRFQSRVEINQPGTGYSTGVKEFYDGENNRSALIITEMGLSRIIIHNHVNGEVLVVKESRSHNLPVYDCVVKQLHQDVMLTSFVNPTWLLREATKTKETYIPNAKPIRGIPVHHWTADILTTDTNLTVDYFYSKATWVNKFNLHDVLIQVKISGTFKIVYNYYDFLNDIPDESVFQTPEGAYCPNRNSTKSIPKLTEQVSYRVEYNSQESELIFSMDVVVDTENHFLRIDYGKLLESGDTQLLSEVHDFNMDVNYKIDRVSGKCVASALRKSSQLDIDVAEETSASGAKTIRMKHPNEMFNFNHDYQYAGQRVFNGILCDIFIARVMNYKISDIPFNVTMEYYFTATWNNDRGCKTTLSTIESMDNWKEVSNRETDSEENVPVLLQIKSLDMSLIQIYRYLDFDQGSLYFSIFDVTSCFNKDEKLDFQVDFTNPGSLTMGQAADLQDMCHIAVAQAASTTPLRLQDVKLHVEKNYLQFVATLVGLPPASSQFKLESGCGHLSKANKLVENIRTAKDCADQCEGENSFICNEFWFCPAKKICSLSEKTNDDGEKGALCCQKFKRVNKLNSKLLPSSKVWTNLKDAVYQGKVIIQFEQMKIVAVNVKDGVLNGASREMGSPNWQKSFTRVKNHIIEGHDALILPGLAVDDCASACFGEENFYCLSFDFCYSNGECRLSKETSVMNPQYLKRSSTCDVYTLNYLTWFNKFPGQTVLPEMDVAYQRVGTADQCASLCFNYAGFTCKSFDYCELIHTCVIGHTHILDVPKSRVNIEPMCSHYSIKYLSDYKKTSNRMLKLDDDEIIADISEEQCAKICSENKKILCTSFDYCSDSQICMYRSKHYVNEKGDMGLKPSIFCNHYTRMIDASVFATADQNNKTPKPTGYSSGSMGILAFFMLLIGTKGALLAIFLYKRYWKKGRDPLSVRMMKDDDTAIY